MDVISGKKTVLQFLSRPIVAMRENAFRERWGGGTFVAAARRCPIPVSVDCQKA